MWVKMKANPDGFMTAIVQVPCVDIDKHGDGKMQRLASEVKLTFGETAEVTLPDGSRIVAENT